MRAAVLATLAAVGFFSSTVHAERVKDIAMVGGVRSNQLIGYGLVVGLDGSGDQTSQTPFTVQSLKSMLVQYGITLPDNVKPQLKNVAAVSIQAELPAFAKPGQTIDITVSSLGNAKSLRGGSLLLTPLKGVDGRVYAMAQGNMVVGGIGAQGKDGSSVTVNIPSAGRIPNGATVEVAVESSFNSSDGIVLNLHAFDFTTASRVAQAINRTLGEGSAKPLDGGSIWVTAPAAGDRVGFVSVLENIEVDPGDAPARVVVNSRTGTVVIGSHVRVSPAAITHGSLTVTIAETYEVSQPAPFSRGGETVVVPHSDVSVSQETNRMFLFKPGVELDEIVRAVNGVGAAPNDLVAILEALKQAGSLRAELIVI
ncbi:MAG: flagellar basal body P-ring protein FlgI [Porticoccaceae bacterium]